LTAGKDARVVVAEALVVTGVSVTTSGESLPSVARLDFNVETSVSSGARSLLPSELSIAANSVSLNGRSSGSRDLSVVSNIRPKSNGASSGAYSEVKGKAAAVA
jgi:hypothetical protein